VWSSSAQAALWSSSAVSGWSSAAAAAVAAAVMSERPVPPPLFHSQPQLASSVPQSHIASSLPHLLSESRGSQPVAHSSLSSPTSSSLVPLHPDVRLKSLPFYDVIDTLLRPSNLGNIDCTATQ